MKGALHMINGRRADVAEVYAEPRIAQEAAIRNYGGERLVPGWSLDLTREDPLTGRPWDLSKRAVSERVKQLVRDTKQFMFIGSPPCTFFCQLQNLFRRRRDPKVFAKRLEDAQKNVKFCLELYEMHRSAARYFLHEHPNTAMSWQMPEVVAFASQSDGESRVRYVRLWNDSSRCGR